MEDKEMFTDGESTPEKGYILRDRSNIQPLFASRNAYVLTFL